MSLTPNFQKLVGTWEGTNDLYLSPDEPARNSTSIASVGLEANAKFQRINYQWSYEGNHQEGLIVFGCGKGDTATMVWIDSFHQSDELMKCLGTLEGDKISVLGNYTQPEYADWAWRTNIEFHHEDSFSFSMFNVEPGGMEHLAVEAKFVRRKSN